MEAISLSADVLCPQGALFLDEFQRPMIKGLNANDAITASNCD